MQIIENPIDQYGDPIPDHKRHCKWCNSSLVRVTQKIPIEQPTNHVVIKTEKNRKHYDEYGDFTYEDKACYKTVWDGESYKRLAYGHFCKVKCAIAFANYIAKNAKITVKK